MKRRIHPINLPGTLAAACLLFGTITACQEAKKPAAEFDPSEIVLNDAQRQKAQWALLDRLFSEQDPTKLSATQADLAVSPSSLVNALQVLWWGTRGETALELAELFGAGPGAAGKKAAANKDDRKKAPALGGSVSLATDSGLWFNEDFPVRDEYRDLLKKRGMGTAEAINWSQVGPAVKKINLWCGEATNGKIPTLFEPGDIQPPVAFVLASVITFKGSWATSFDPESTRTEDFTRFDGEKMPAAFLTAKRKAQFAKLEDGTALLELPFSGGHHRLIAVLPAKAGAKHLRNLEKKLAKQMPDWLASLKEAEVSISLPKFEVSGAWDPGEAVKALGVKRIFSDQKADFSGASEARGLKLDVLRHQAVVSIDEKGAEAAGATGASVTLKSLTPTPEFRADRPFLYFILGDTGDVLFAGRVAAPKSGGTVSAGVSVPAL